jgi:hypothetical protein
MYGRLRKIRLTEPPADVVVNKKMCIRTGELALPYLLVPAYLLACVDY